MWRALVRKAHRLVQQLAGVLVSETAARRGGQRDGEKQAIPNEYGPLERIRLTDEVGRTLFEEYAHHRRGSRGNEETGWLLLGVREQSETLVLATLPAGALREAGVAHVQFNSSAQALGSRIVRQVDRRLSIVGVVHTHPGSLRHPSDGDFQGDSAWVGQLRGEEGIFAIGTAEANGSPRAIAEQPHPHVQRLGDLCLSWYALRKGDRRYRTMPVELTLGPDLARALHSVWPIIETHAERLDRLCRQQARVTFEVVPHGERPALAATIRLADANEELRVVLDKKEVAYYLLRGQELLAVDLPEIRVDRGVYLLLADLAAQG